MAAGAVDGEAEGAAGEHVDAIIDDFLVVAVATAQREEAHSGEVAVIGFLLVGSDLFNEKFVVWLVFVH